MKKLLLSFIMLFSLFLMNAEAEFNLKLNEGVQAADDFEKLVFSAAPKLKNALSFFDVSTKDGHLIVWIKKNMLMSKTTAQNNVYNLIFELWKETKYVREKSYGNWVEIRYQDYTTGKSRTIKTIH